MFEIFESLLDTIVGFCHGDMTHSCYYDSDDDDDEYRDEYRDLAFKWSSNGDFDDNVPIEPCDGL